MYRLTFVGNYTHKTKTCLVCRKSADLPVGGVLISFSSHLVNSRVGTRRKYTERRNWCEKGFLRGRGGRIGIEVLWIINAYGCLFEVLGLIAGTSLSYCRIDI